MFYMCTSLYVSLISWFLWAVTSHCMNCEVRTQLQSLLFSNTTVLSLSSTSFSSVLLTGIFSYTSNFERNVLSSKGVMHRNIAASIHFVYTVQVITSSWSMQRRTRCNLKLLLVSSLVEDIIGESDGPSKNREWINILGTSSLLCVLSSLQYLVDVWIN